MYTKEDINLLRAGFKNLQRCSNKANFYVAMIRELQVKRVWENLREVKEAICIVEDMLLEIEEDY